MHCEEGLGCRLQEIIVPDHSWPVRNPRKKKMYSSRTNAKDGVTFNISPMFRHQLKCFGLNRQSNGCLQTWGYPSQVVDLKHAFSFHLLCLCLQMRKPFYSSLALVRCPWWETFKLRMHVYVFRNIYIYMYVYNIEKNTYIYIYLYINVHNKQYTHMHTCNPQPKGIQHEMWTSSRLHCTNLSLPPLLMHFEQHF